MAAKKKGIRKKKGIKPKPRKPSKRKPTKRNPVKPLSKREKKLLAEVERLRKELEVKEFFKDFVDATEPGWLRENRTVALQFSSLRHQGRVTRKVRAALREAEEKSPHGMEGAAFKQTANDIAIFFKIPLKEVYTLWISP